MKKILYPVYWIMKKLVNMGGFALDVFAGCSFLGKKHPKLARFLRSVDEICELIVDIIMMLGVIAMTPIWGPIWIFLRVYKYLDDIYNEKTWIQEKS